MEGLPVVTLGAGGHAMPLVGMGTAAYPFAPPEQVRSAVLHAIRLGYRHFDTAAIYQTEQPVGEAIAEALRRGLVKSRDELFITTKLWCCDAHRDLVVPALRNSLSNLGLDYVDLYLVHLPVSMKPGQYTVDIKEEDLMMFDVGSVWEAMEQCQKLGLARAIGVSNFSCSKLERLLETASIPPAVNQVEMSPLWRQKKLREFCSTKGIHVCAYSPLGATGTIWGSERVLGNPILREIAEAKGKTVAQVCLRWVYDHGVSLAVKSFNERRMEENQGIFEWDLDEEDFIKIDQIPEQKSFLGLWFCSRDGQYKSPADLWDGEV